jgi:hypothetical protein
MNDHKHIYHLEKLKSAKDSNTPEEVLKDSLPATPQQGGVGWGSPDVHVHRHACTHTCIHAVSSIGWVTSESLIISVLEAGRPRSRTRLVSP